VWGTVRGNPDKTKPYRWKQGCPSPNPGGRPKRTPYADAHREIAEGLVKDLKIRANDSVAFAIAKAVAREALGGEIPAAVEIANRVEGIARQRVEVTGENSAPIQIEDVHERLMEKLLKE
jgi:Family of unknown function (DUF5681)